jgi:hypothetical protein
MVTMVTNTVTDVTLFQGPIKITNALLSLVTIDAYNALLYYKGTFALVTKLLDCFQSFFS